MMSKSIYAKTVRPKKVQVLAESFNDPEVLREHKRDDMVKSHTEFRTTAEKLARSSIYHVHFYVPELVAKHRFNDAMQSVSKMFPFAAGGKLLVDEPEDKFEVDECKEKEKILVAAGYRYIYIEQGDKLDIAQSKLEEVDHELVKRSNGSQN